MKKIQTKSGQNETRLKQVQNSLPKQTFKFTATESTFEPPFNLTSNYSTFIKM